MLFSENSFFASLDYCSHSELSAVKTAFENGDFDIAKSELVKYYKQRNLSGTKLGFDITDDDKNYPMAVLPMRNILTGPYEFDVWQGEFCVSSDTYTVCEIDVTDRILQELSNGAVSFMLLASKKNSDKVLVSKSGVPPKLSLTLENGKTAEIIANHATYISSKNADTAYGNADELAIFEDDTDVNRTYINFPLESISNSTISSAKLIVSARCEASALNEILVINIGDTVWDESTLTWASVRGNIYSYENADVPVWNAAAPNCDSEYHNVTARFWFGKPMVYEYLSYLKNPTEYNASHPHSKTYNGKTFGDKLIDLMSAFATQMQHGYPRTLETGERLNRWVDIIDALLPTGIFDDRAEDFYKIISFMKGDCDYIYSLDIGNSKHWWSNWRIVANAGFFKATEYFFELSTHSEYRKKAEYNVEYTIDLLYGDDMSFKEAGPSYAQWCAELFGDCAIMARKCNNSMSDDFIKKLIGATVYALNSFFPNGYDSNVGDSNYRSKLSKFKTLAEFLNNETLNAYVSNSDNYRNHLSVIYPNANSAYMRSGWNCNNSVYLSLANNPYDGHCHPDSNQVLLYAYGHPLLVDSGRYSYSSTNNIYHELRTAAAHNTIELVNSNMDTHSVAADKINTWANNDMFTFVSSTQHGYADVSHTRSVLFFKDTTLPILVTDYIVGKKAQTFRQNWHFMPSSNARACGNSVSTDFYEKANISIVTADTVAQIRDGYFSADYGLVAKSKYATFEKSGTDVKFSTILMPSKSGNGIRVTADDLAQDNRSSVVVSANMLFYVKHTSTADSLFDKYSTDAQAAFVGANIFGMVNGSVLKSDIDYIVASENIRSIGIIRNGSTVTISCEQPNASIKLYAPNVRHVILNGKEIRFTQSDEYIYI